MIQGRGVFYFSVLTVVMTWCLILVGGVVHGTGSSLACPDWPTCYGSFFPEMKGGVFFEHSHRLVASLVGLLTLILCGLCWNKGKQLRRLGLLAVALVIFQGILGGITVLYLLPPAVSTLHLATSMAFFAVLIGIASLCREAIPPRGGSVSPEPSQSPAVRAGLGIALVLVYLQIVLGGLVRHWGAGLACVDIPLCQGSLWPPEAPFLVKLHMFHRLFAVGVAVAVFTASFLVWKASRRGSWLRFLSGLLPVLILMQIGLGLLSVHSALELVPVTAHLGLGALIWGLLVWVFL